MTPLFLSTIALAAALVIWVVVRRWGRVAFTRSAVLDEVRRALRGGTVEQTPGRGPQARGRLGQLEVTVDLHHDLGRPEQSPMWRVLAVGPVRVDRPIEFRAGGWQGWIDPWMELVETRSIPWRVGSPLEVHSERALRPDHPALLSMLRQSTGLGPGALHLRPDLMRAEIRFSTRARDNRPLLAWLQTMAEISDATTGRGQRESDARVVLGPHARAISSHRG